MASEQFRFQPRRRRLKVVALSRVELILEVDQSPSPPSRPFQTLQSRRQFVPQQTRPIQMLLRSLTTTARLLHLVTMLPDAADLLDRLATLVRSQTQHLVDQTLAHQRESAAAEAAAAEQVLHIAQSRGTAVDPHFRLPVAVHAAHDLQFSWLQVEAIGRCCRTADEPRQSRRVRGRDHLRRRHPPLAWSANCDPTRRRSPSAARP